MRRETLLMKDWRFTMPGAEPETCDLPHTWNAVDGQDGGNDYLRTACVYEKTFPIPDFSPGSERVFLVFDGVNASCRVTLNGTEIISHDGGYSTFRADITDQLLQENELSVLVDNSVNDRVYPQKADFTFYGGIYRNVKILIVNRNHFDLLYYGGPGIRVTARPEGENAKVLVDTWVAGEGEVKIRILDAEGDVVAEKTAKDGEERKGTSRKSAGIKLSDVHRWDGIRDPYLYSAEAILIRDGEIVDRIRTSFGVREFRFDPEAGFFLNGRSYPLHGVSRHQDRRGSGNAITQKEHEEDMELIREVGANTIRLAHYQHDQFFYDLCDRYGMIVWAEIPYISEHMPNGRDNTVSQMKELIIQNYNHPCIVCWGISNEITISTKDHKDMMSNHRMLNDMIHEMDHTRLTTLACYAMCNPFDPVVHKVSDLVGYNLYLGWYVPFPWLNDIFLSFFHRVWPRRRLCYSEYGAEGMPNLHARKPRRGDQTEDYQNLYHEFMLECFKRHPYMWGTYVWNMFDFAADARDQGGEPGMNHKGLVTFDRRTKKDCFFLYKAYWSDDPFVYIAGRRRKDREEKQTEIRVYTNEPSVTLYVNGEERETQAGSKVFIFKVDLSGETAVKVVTEHASDEVTFRKVIRPNPEYKLKKSKGKSANWV
ncbi:MAG: glycoside hydrolase family 2 protein [Lachnospiraceae bacterium]|nr:glycoside hydrolase family 2 protein [Lachnospiraceae bacterium]